LPSFGYYISVCPGVVTNNMEICQNSGCRVRQWGRILPPEFALLRRRIASQGFQELRPVHCFSLRIHVQEPNYSYRSRTLVLTISYFHPGTFGRIKKKDKETLICATE